MADALLPIATRSASAPVAGSIRTIVGSSPPATQTPSSPAATATGSAPTGAVQVTVSVTGSIRESVPSGRLTTQTPPAPAAIAPGPFPTLTARVSAPVRGSRRLTVPASSLATQTPPSPAAIAVGSAASAVERTRSASARSIRRTRPSAADATHSAPNPTASAFGALPAARRWTTRFAPGSIWATVRLAPSATQSEPAPNATALGSPPTSVVPTSSLARSTRDTVPSRALAVHSEPAPAASAAGPCPTARCSTIRPLSGSIRPTASSAIRGSPSGRSMRVKASSTSPATRHAAPTASARRGRRGGGRGSAGAAVPGRAARSRAGSWRSTASWSRCSSGPGSTPISSTSVARAARTRRAPPPGARAVQREHALRVQPLAERMGGDERVELGDHLGVPARGQVGLDGRLRRARPQLVEPADLRSGEWLVGEVGERIPVPQRERLARPPSATRRANRSASTSPPSSRSS